MRDVSPISRRSQYKEPSLLRPREEEIDLRFHLSRPVSNVSRRYKTESPFKRLSGSELKRSSLDIRQEMTRDRFGPPRDSFEMSRDHLETIRDRYEALPPSTVTSGSYREYPQARITSPIYPDPPDELEVIRAQRAEMEKMRREIEREKQLLLMGHPGPSMDTPPAPRPMPTQPQPAVDPDIRHGNYLLACCEFTSWARRGGCPSLYQLGAYLPHGVSQSSCTLPEDLTKEEVSLSHEFSSYNNKVSIRMGGKFFLPKSRDSLLAEFLDFLEKGCQTVRPAFEGVIVICYNFEDIPCMVKAVMKAGLYERYNRLVKGYADLCSFISQAHAWKFMDKGKIDLSFEHIHLTVFGERFHSMNRGPDEKAKSIHECLDRLLENKPSFGNFVSKYALHPKARLITKLVSFQSEPERMKLFLPLQIFIADELAKEHMELILEEVYVPSENDEKSQLSQSELVAIKMCSVLVQAGLEFPLLLQAYQDFGLAELELKLRTSFLDKMAKDKSRQVIDLTIRTQKLAIAFFRRCGHLPLNRLLRKTELQIQARKLKKLKGSPAEMNAVPKSIKELSGLQSFLAKLLVKSRECQLSNPVAIGDSVVQLIIQSGLNHTQLQQMYLADKEVHSSRHVLRSSLIRILQGQFDCLDPPSALSIGDMVGYIIDYLGNSNAPHSSKAKELTTKAKADLPKEDAYRCLMIHSQKLDQAINADKALNMNQFRVRILSLAALKSSLSNSICPRECVDLKDFAIKAQDYFAKLISLSGFNHFQLKALFDKSEADLAGNVYSSLRIHQELIPNMIWSIDVIVEAIVQYFQQFNGRLSTNTNLCI